MFNLYSLVEQRLGKVLDYRCLCDDYLPIFKVVAYNPLSVMGVAVLFWIILIAIYGPLWLVSFAISTWGAVIMFFTGFVLLSQYIARSMAFPGSVKSFQRNYATLFIKKTTDQLSEIGSAATVFTKMLMQVAASRSGTELELSTLMKVADLRVGSEYLSNMAGWMSEALEEVKKESLHAQKDQWFLCIKRTFSVGRANDAQDLAQLEEELESARNLITAIAALAQQMQALITFSNRALSMSPTQRVSAAPALQAIAGATYQASALLQSAATAARPVSIDQSDSTPQASGVVEEIGGKQWHAAWRTLREMSKETEGIAKLSFAIMRAQMKSELAGERVLLTGAEGNIIDVMYIPCQEKNPHLSSNQSQSTPKLGTCSAVGTVLLCGPNGGMYEQASQVSPQFSWLGFYQRLGFDVCIWNYRGYNSSTGIPTPRALQGDALLVTQHLRQRGVQDLLVHGESIGGMMAAYVAAYSQPSPRMVVMDRTFASLDAVAERLLGYWSNWSLRYLGCWDTDVVKCFTDVPETCHKLVLQDAQDAIIHDTASLKSALSLHAVLEDVGPWGHSDTRRQLPATYRRAEILNTGVESVEVNTEILLLRAQQAKDSLPEEFVSHFIACVCEISTLALQATRVRLKASAAMALVVEAADETSQHATVNPIAAAARTLDDEEAACWRVSEGTGDRDAVAHGSEADKLPSSTYPSEPLPIELAWGTLCRADNVSGQLLGHASSLGVPGIRSWLCTYIAWAGLIAGQSATMIPRKPFRRKAATALSVTCVAEELQRLLGQYGTPSLETSEVEEPRGLPPHVVSSLRFIQNSLVLLVDKQVPPDKHSLPQSRRARLGHLLPLDCGHNGWPAANAVQAVMQCVKMAGFHTIQSSWAHDSEALEPGQAVLQTDALELTEISL